MKEKTLTERLREADADEKCTGEVFEAITGNQYSVGCRVKCTECLELALKDIADAIEHEYVSREQHEAEIKAIVEAQGYDGYSNGYPHHIMKVYAEEHGMPMKKGETISGWLGRWFLERPRFEDGEPVQFGDEVFIPANETINMSSDQYVVEGMRFYKDFTRFDRAASQKTNFISVSEGERVKRPTHKVYDADWVEIKVGDIVYEGDGLTPLKVICIHKNGDITAIGEGGLCSKLDSSEYSHDCTVLDADRVRIRKGDTVWYLLSNTILGGKRLEVVQIKSAEEVLDTFPHIIVKDDDGASYTLFPHNLTHREPDSLAKILDEFGTIVQPTESAYGELISRLTALDERGA